MTVAADFVLVAVAAVAAESVLAGDSCTNRGCSAYQVFLSAVTLLDVFVA